MRTFGRVLIWGLILCGGLASWSGVGPARAAVPPVHLALTAITVPGLSPLAGLVNRAGTRALLVGADAPTHRTVLLLYDLHSRRLLHRSLAPATVRNVESSLPTLNERRGRAYVLLVSHTGSTTRPPVSAVECVIDLTSGRLLATRPLGADIPAGPNPVINEGTGALWFVASRPDGTYLVQTGPRGITAGTQRVRLPPAFARGANVLWLDQARRRVIVGTVGPDASDYVGIDLATGRHVWTRHSAIPFQGGPWPLFDPASGAVWIADPLAPIVSVIDAIDGRQRRMVLGTGGAVGDLLLEPGRGVFALVLSSPSDRLVHLSAAPLGHRLVSTYPAARVGHLITRMAGGAGLYTGTAIAVPPAGGMLLACYLSRSAQQADGVHLLTTSRLSIVDWQEGRLRAQAALPVTGTLFPLSGGLLDRGFYQTLGLGRGNYDDQGVLQWGSMAVLVATIR